MKIPNFFIVGAPKCGTTALSEYLREHSRVTFSNPKEPHYFSSDLQHRGVTTERQYLNCFDISASDIAVGEASVMYLFSKVAVASAYQYNPDAKFIVMLRSPLEMMPSYHSQLLVSGYEDVTDFAQAWALQEPRAKAQRIPPRCPEPKLLQYAEVGALGSQLERLYRTVPKAQVLVIFYDDFAKDTAGVYRRVVEFLGLPDEGRSEFARVNANKVVQSQRVVRLLGMLNDSFLAKISRRIRMAFGIPHWGWYARLINFLLKFHMKEAPRPPLSEEMKLKLIDCYRADVAKLSLLTGRDLSGWLAVEKMSD